MAIEVDKSLIKQRFAKSVNIYNSNAVVQAQIAVKLGQLIYDKLGTSFGRVVELGAGTGLLTHELLSLLNIEKLYCNDMVEEYLPKLQAVTSRSFSQFKFIVGDLEQTDLFPHEIELLTSASTLQWILDLDTLFAGFTRRMKQGGVVAFSTFGDKNLLEIRDIMQSGLFYNSFESLKQIVQKHFDIIYEEQETRIMYFNDPVDVLRHLKNTGVNAIFKSSWTKKDIEHFSEIYKQKYATENGFQLTYHPMYILGKKK